jgi:putative transport protein
MAEVFTFLREQPFVMLFVVVGAGFALARLNIFGVSPGVVACTLLAGLVLSLWAVRSANVSFAVPYVLQALFFNLYIFCVGLRVGPQCFAGLERNGRQFVGVAVLVLIATFVLAVLCGWLFHLDAGTLAGLIAGSNTASAAFGAAQSAAKSGAAGPNGEALAVNMSVSFAIAYALSLASSVILLPLLPKLTNSDAAAAAKQAENELSRGKAPLPQTPDAFRREYLPVDIRAYRIEKPRAVGKSVDVLRELHPLVTVEGVRRAGRMLAVDGNLVLQLGDEVALGGRVEQQQRILQEVGPEIDVADLRAFYPETADVVITRQELVGKTLGDLTRGAGHGLFFNAAFRMGEEIPLKPQTQFKRNDVLRVTGTRAHIDALAAAAGNLIKGSSTTDLLTISAGLVLGGLLGGIAVYAGAIKLSIGSAGGLLIVAILMSWLRTRYPQFGGPIPEAGRQLLEDLGLSIFVATVGLTAGPGLTKALTAGVGGPIVLSTVVVGFVPPVVAWIIGITVFKLNPALLLGAVTGARQSSPTLKVAQYSVRSTIPAIGFPVPFTIATLVLTFYGYLGMVFWPIKQ